MSQNEEVEYTMSVSVRKRGIIKAQVTRIKSYLDNIKNDGNILQLKARRQKREKWGRL